MPVRSRAVGEILIEVEDEVRVARCEGCGGTDRRAQGFVYDDGDAHGIYFVEWCDGDHGPRAAFLTLGLGEFADGSGPDDRMAFGIEWRAEGMTLTDEPVRDRPDLLGAFVPREEALGLPEPVVAHLWHVVDHIVLDDERLADLRAWLDSRPRGCGRADEQMG